jgi:hypothetical protein
MVVTHELMSFKRVAGNNCRTNDHGDRAFTASKLIVRAADISFLGNGATNVSQHVSFF